jgi:hypothetical protein
VLLFSDIMFSQIQVAPTISNMKARSTFLHWSLSLLATFLLVHAQGATTINFAVHLGADTAVTSANLSGPNGVAAGAEVWNLPNLSGGHNPSMPGASNLVDSTGAATAVGVTFDGFGGPDDWGYNSPLKLLWSSARGFYNGPGNEASFTITGLTPDSVHNLWIATSHIATLNSGKGVGDWSTLNANSTGSMVGIDNTGNETNGSTWVAGVNYVLFENIVADSSGKIKMNGHAITPNPNDSRVGFNGFQLSSVLITTPEPSRALLAGCGLLGMILRRRRP